MVIEYVGGGGGMDYRYENVYLNFFARDIAAYYVMYSSEQIFPYILRTTHTLDTDFCPFKWQIHS